MNALRRRLIRTAWRFHVWVYRTTRGRIGGRLGRIPVLLLTTTGRRTGRPHTRALTYVPDGKGVVVIGSYGGAPRHPDWVLNLKAHPRAVVQVYGHRIRVRAREAAGAERSQLWGQAVQAYSGYAVYQSRTPRMIPVIVLERENGGMREK